jgi:hypothetical protein
VESDVIVQLCSSKGDLRDGLRSGITRQQAVKKVALPKRGREWRRREGHVDEASAKTNASRHSKTYEIGQSKTYEIGSSNAEPKSVPPSTSAGWNVEPDGLAGLGRA